MNPIAPWSEIWQLPAPARARRKDYILTVIAIPITSAVDRNTAPAAEKAHTLGTVASNGAALDMLNQYCGV